MSGAQTSAWPDQNILYNAASGMTASNVLHNQLLNQETQQTIAGNNTEVVARAAATLADPTLYPTEEARAAAYPGIVAQLRANGYPVPNAPANYPGLDHLKATAQLGISTMDRYKLGLMTSPGTQAILDRVFGTGGTTPSSVGTTTGGDGGAATTGVPAANAGALRDQLVSTLGVSPVDAGAILSNFHAESGLNAGINEIHPVIPGSRGGYGLAQWTGPRRDALETFAQQNKLDVSQPATQLAFMKQELQQPEYAGVLKAMQAAQTPEEKAAVFFHGYLSGNAPSLEHNLPGHIARARAYAGLPAAQANAVPPGTPTAPAAPPGVQMGGAVPPPPGGASGAYPAYGAGVGAVVGQGVRPNVGGPQQTVAPPPVIRAQPIPAGRTTVGSNADIMMGGVQQAQATPLSGTRVAGPPMVASTQPTAPVPAEDLTPTPARFASTAPAPSVAAPPEAGWGSQVGSYGPQNALAPAAVQPPAAAQPVAAAPAPQQPSPAAAQPTVATGVNSPQFQLAQQKLRQAAAIAAMPGYQYNPQLQAAAAYLKEQAAALAQADSVIQTPAGQVHTLTGKIDNPAQPNAHYVWSPEQRAYIDTTGTHPPVTPPSPRFSPPTVDPATGKPAVAVEGGQGGTKYLPIPDRPATATFDLQKEQHKRDTDELPKYNEQNQQAAANQIRIQQMRELIDQISTGAGGAERANWANIAEQMGWTDLSKRLIGMGGAAAAQEFAKYGLATAGAQERGDLGARGSLGAITLYKSANPGLELQPDANKKMLTAQLIAAQANRDYTQGAMDYVNRNGDAFVIHGANYTPLSHFDAEWAAQRSPQIYAAAMSAINGDPWQKWTKALNMKDATDVQRVVDIVRRADPTSSIMWKNGEPHDVGTSQ